MPLPIADEKGQGLRQGQPERATAVLIRKLPVDGQFRNFDRARSVAE